MQLDPRLLEFIEGARAHGASDGVLLGLLKGHGWPEESIYRALGVQYEKLTGLAVPSPKSSTASAKEAFFYLLAFSTLATWTIGLGSLMFTLIDQWIPDPLATYSYYNQYSIASSTASILVAFPIYIFMMSLILREIRKDPGKLESSIRKWLTYIALFIAAAVIIGDLITILTYFLHGSLTGRFIAKAVTVMLIAGSVFWYYLSSLKRTVPGASDVRE